MLAEAQKALRPRHGGVAFSGMAYAAAWTFLAAVTKYVSEGTEKRDD